MHVHAQTQTRQSANGRPIATVEDLEEVLGSIRADGREAVLLRVRTRQGVTQSIPVRFIEE